MSGDPAPALELHDIQSGVLRPRPSPYAATYILFRIDEPKAGRDLMSRLSRVVTAASEPRSPMGDAWVSVALTFQGLKALGAPQASLASPAADPDGQTGLLNRIRQRRAGGVVEVTHERR